jgi:hypothetical protein
MNLMPEADSRAHGDRSVVKLDPTRRVIDNE